MQASHWMKKYKTKIQIKIGLRIKELRKRAKLSQEALALRAMIDRTYINSVENGRRNILIRNVEKIADALGVSLKEFFSSKSFQELNMDEEEWALLTRQFWIT